MALTGVTVSNCINTFHNDVIALEEGHDERKTLRRITLEPHTFQEFNNAVSYINESMATSDVTFSLNERNYLILKIISKSVTVKFDNTLRDIFGFLKNSYSGPGEFKAESSFSLTRCIDYLYIYSNISEYVRVGNTKAPLLGIVSFESGKECDHLRENLFDNPTYVSVIQNDISQIDIGIYDGVGELIPFAKNATTVLQLHFRPSQ